MSSTPFFADQTCSLIKTLLRRQKQTTYSDHWKTYTVKTFQITVTYTYLVSTKELVSKIRDKKLLAVVTKRTRRHLDLEPNPLPSAVQARLEKLLLTRTLILTQLLFTLSSIISFLDFFSPFLFQLSNPR